MEHIVPLGYKRLKYFTSGSNEGAFLSVCEEPRSGLLVFGLRLGRRDLPSPVDTAGDRFILTFCIFAYVFLSLFFFYLCAISVL